MERIDLFDRYFNGELSEEENIRFKERLDADEEFASDFKIYSMTVAGICKEAEQDNVDFGAAMKHLSKDQLYEIIGRKPKSISREEVINRLRSRIVLDRAQGQSYQARLPLMILMTMNTLMIIKMTAQPQSSMTRKRNPVIPSVYSHLFLLLS